jgi:hypothetical protein
MLGKTLPMNSRASFASICERIRLGAKVAILLLIVTFAFSSFLHGQIDPQEGRRLTAALESTTSQLMAGKSAYKLMLRVGPFQQSIDEMMATMNLTGCESLRSYIQEYINSFQYNRARQSLEECKSLLVAADTILSEDLLKQPSAFTASKKRQLYNSCRNFAAFRWINHSSDYL